MICSNAHSWRSSFVDSKNEEERKDENAEKHVAIVSENDIVRAKTALSKKNLVESSSDIEEDNVSTQEGDDIDDKKKTEDEEERVSSKSVVTKQENL